MCSLKLFISALALCLCWVRGTASKSTEVTVSSLLLCGKWNDSSVHMSLQTAGGEEKTTEAQICNATSCKSQVFGTVSWDFKVDGVQMGLWVAGDELGAAQLWLSDLAADTWNEVALNSTRIQDDACANTLEIRFHYEVDRDGQSKEQKITGYVVMGVVGTGALCLFIGLLMVVLGDTSDLNIKTNRPPGGR